MKVSWSCFIACPSPIVPEFCNIRFILPWVFRSFFLPSFYLFYLFSSCFCFVLFFFLLLNHFPLLSFLHTLPVFQNLSQLSFWLSFLLFFEWSCVYNNNLWEGKILSQAFNTGADTDRQYSRLFESCTRNLVTFKVQFIVLICTEIPSI
jgi:hypothetical protein